MAIAALAQPVAAGASGTAASVACKPLDTNRVRCAMTIKGGTGISATVRMRITRGVLLVALGQGHVTRGKATLIMRLLHRMTPGQYKVSMVVTVNTTMVVRVR